MKRSIHLLVILALLAALGVFAYIYSAAREAGPGLPETAAPEAPEDARMSLYYPNNELGDYSIDCADVFPVERLIPYEEGDDLFAALVAALLDGPTAAEQSEGFSSPFANGSALLSAERQGTLVHLDFNADFNRVAGSCRIESIRSSILRTMRQFSSVEGVVISVEGNAEEALQP